MVEPQQQGRVEQRQSRHASFSSSLRESPRPARARRAVAHRASARRYLGPAGPTIKRPGRPHRVPMGLLYLRVGAACEIVRQSTAILTSRRFRPSMRAPISIITLLSSGHLNGRSDVETAAELAHLAGAFL